MMYISPLTQNSYEIGDAYWFTVQSLGEWPKALQVLTRRVFWTRNETLRENRRLATPERATIDARTRVETFVKLGATRTDAKPRAQFAFEPHSSATRPHHRSVRISSFC